METPLIFIGILGIFSAIYLVLCSLDEKLKWQLVENRNEKMKVRCVGKMGKVARDYV